VTVGEKDDDLYSGGEDEKGSTGDPDMGDGEGVEPAEGKPDTVIPQRRRAGADDRPDAA
jgi:hypothetical protein